MSAHNLSGDSDLLNRHQDIWFDDGNIVLIANTTCFKVHRSVLSRSSEVFSGMFSIPQPPKPDPGCESVDGCAVIHLSDTPEDVAYFLEVLYHGFRYFRQAVTITWPIVRAMLHLGSKYQVDELYDAAVELLHLTFPRKWSPLTMDDAYGPNCHRNNSYISFRESDLLEIANSARRFGLNDVLPVVLYDCCSLGIEKLLGYQHSGDRSVVPLDVGNLRGCMIAFQRLAVVACTVAPVLFSNPKGNDKACENRVCADTRMSVQAELEELISDDGYIAIQSLDTWLYKRDKPGGTNLICWSCRDNIIHRRCTIMREISDDLEAYFDLPCRVDL